MQGISRRGFIGVAAGAAVGTSASAALGQGAAASVRGLRERRAGIDFGHDGIPFTANEFAAQLAELAKGRQDLGDEYSRGGAVARLEAQFAALLGKETAVFMPSGTLANHLALRALAGTRRRVIVPEMSHIYNDTGDACQTLSALTLVPLAPGTATFTVADVEAVLARTASGRVAAVTPESL